MGGKQLEIVKVIQFPKKKSRNAEIIERNKKT
jgi:hypothetical protein